MSCHNCIVSSQANVYFANNSPSQFKCRTPNEVDAILDQKLDWFMALKCCSIPNRFNTISSDRTCFITVQKIFSQPARKRQKLRNDWSDTDDYYNLDSADVSEVDGGQETVYIKPGCYLTARDLAEAITESFTESGLPLECVLVTKMVQLLRPSGNGEMKTYPVIRNSSYSVVEQMLKALQDILLSQEKLLAGEYKDCEAAVRDAESLIGRLNKKDDVRLMVKRLSSPLLAIRETPPHDNDDDDDDDDDEDDENGERQVEYYIDISPILARICGFEPDSVHPANVSSHPILSKEGVDLKVIYPQQFLLCSNVLCQSYVVESRDFTPQRFLYHFTVPDPVSHSMIKAENGTGQDIEVTQLRLDTWHFTMCDLDGRQLEIEDGDLTTWLHIRMSSARKLSAT